MTNRERLLMQKADEAWYSGHLQEAVARYRAATRQGVEGAWNRLGDALAQTGQLDEARDCYRRGHNLVALETLERPEFRLTVKLEQVGAIYSYGRSGSLLFQSLLDGHPQLISMPGAYMDRFYQFWADCGQAACRDVLQRFETDYAPLFDVEAAATRFCHSAISHGFDAMGPDRNSRLGLDSAVFRGHLEDLCSGFDRLCSRFLFQALHAAYCLTLGERLEGRKWLIFQHHVYFDRGEYTVFHGWMGYRPAKEDTRRLLLDFPSTCHLHCLREPLATMASRYTHISDPDFWAHAHSASLGAYVMSSMLLGGEPSMESVRDLAVGVRLEDLHRQGRATMQAVAGHLALDWNECLLRSTFQGVQWWNVAKAPVVSGFSASMVDRKTQHYSGLDRLRLDILFAPKRAFWGYPVSKWSSTPWARLIVLPWLLVPFRLEWTSWRHEFSRPAGWIGRCKRLLVGYLVLRWNFLVALREAAGPRPEVDVLPVAAEQAAAGKTV